MKFEGTKITGWENALVGMRLPMSKNYTEAKQKVDSLFYEDGSLMQFGENDRRICKNLIMADNLDNKVGTPNSKFLRMLHIQVAITAPLYWWKEADTYKVGTTANSTSTMHKLATTEITRECFENPDMISDSTVTELEKMRQEYLESKEKDVWKKLVVNLPEAWLQTRMFDCNYETVRNMVSWRSKHKLSEWREDFIEWAKSLPYASELIFPLEDME